MAAGAGCDPALNEAMGGAIKGLLGGIGGSYDKVGGVQTGSGKAEAEAR